MTTTLYIYVGHENCGSGLIRQTLAAGHGALMSAGIGLCSAAFSVVGKKAGVTFPDKFLADKLEAQQAGKKVDLAAEFQALHAKAEALKLKAVILTGEGLNTPAAADMLAAAKSYFDCKIIYYFARQDDWLVESWRRGAFKTGVGLHTYVHQQLSAADKGIYQGVLSAYMGVFGAEHMRVRLTWPKVLEGGHIAADFWSAVGAEATLAPELPTEEAGLTDELRSALKESPYLFDGTNDSELTDFITSMHVTSGSAQGYPLDDDTRREIMERFKAENHWIKHTFLKNFAMPGWNSVPKRQGAEPIENDPVTVAGVTEALNLNLMLLKELREDISKIKKNMGLK